MKTILQISLVIAIPYSLESVGSLWNTFLTIYKSSHKFNNIRLRITHKKAVSSLSVYEAAYTYCPNHSLIIASRFNIEFSHRISSVLKELNLHEFPYYVASFIDKKGK